MSSETNRTSIERPEQPAFKTLHPSVYAALGGAVLWFVLAVWEFSGSGDADYLLAIVSGFIAMATAIPLILWRVSKKTDVPGTLHENEAVHTEQRSFRDWASADFVTWQDRLRGRNAAIEALLPIAVAAFGMTVFGIVFHIAAHNPIHVS
jgi:hypothetical protein